MYFCNASPDANNTVYINTLLFALRPLRMRVVISCRLCCRRFIIKLSWEFERLFVRCQDPSIPFQHFLWCWNRTLCIVFYRILTLLKTFREKRPDWTWLFRLFYYRSISGMWPELIRYQILPECFRDFIQAYFLWLIRLTTSIFR